MPGASIHISVILPYGSATGVPPTNLNLSPTIYPLPPVDLLEELLDSIAPTPC